MESEKKVIPVGSTSGLGKAALTKALLEAGQRSVEIVSRAPTQNKKKELPPIPTFRHEDYPPEWNRHEHKSVNGKRNQPCRCGSGKKTKKCCGTRAVK